MTQPQESTSAATTRATSVEDQTGNNNHTTGKRLKNKIVSLINGTDYLVEFPLWLYVALMMSIAIIGAAGVNALFAYITYPPETAAVTDVWVWPNSICFDLVITAGLSFGITWLLSPTMAMRDIIVRSPLAIDPTTFPRVTRKLPCAKWLAHNPVFCTDPQNPISKVEAGWRQLRMAVLGGVLLAIFLAIPISLLMMIPPTPWTTGRLIILKGVFGGVGEAISVVIAFAVLIIQFSPRVRRDSVQPIVSTV